MGAALSGPRQMRTSQIVPKLPELVGNDLGSGVGIRRTRPGAGLEVDGLRQPVSGTRTPAMTDEATQAHKPTKPVLKGAPRQWIIEFTGDAVYANPVGMTTNDSFDSIQLLLQHGPFDSCAICAILARLAQKRKVY